MSGPVLSPPAAPFSYRAPELKAIAILALIGLAWSGPGGVRFGGYGLALAIVAVLLALWFAYGASGRSMRISNMCYIAAQWIGFSMTAGAITYLAARASLPLVDAELARVDAALGFSWVAWFRFTQDHWLLQKLLALAYDSLPVQMLMATFYFSHPARMARNRELFFHALLSIAITSVLSCLYPAVGTFAYFGVEQGWARHLPHLLQLRGSGELHFAFKSMEGIIAFPSYHTVLAILYIHAYRGTGRLFHFVLGLNLLMLLSTPGQGGHYLADVLAGAVVAFLAIAAVRGAGQRLRAAQGTALPA